MIVEKIDEVLERENNLKLLDVVRCHYVDNWCSNLDAKVCGCINLWRGT